MVNVAAPALLTTPEPSEVPLLENITVPIGTTPLTEAIDAERVTGCPTVTGFGVAISVTCDADCVVPAVDSNAPTLGGLGRRKPFASVVTPERYIPAPSIGLLAEGMKL
jgi:hypothetical protein